VHTLYYESLLLTSTRMQLGEFLSFMCRVSHELCKDTPYANELLYLKLDKMLPIWLESVNKPPTFTFDHDFDCDRSKNSIHFQLDDDDFDTSESKEL
jgi:hypothetical protein